MECLFFYFEKNYDYTKENQSFAFLWSKSGLLSALILGVELSWGKSMINVCLTLHCCIYQWVHLLSYESGNDKQIKLDAVFSECGHVLWWSCYYVTAEIHHFHSFISCEQMGLYSSPHNSATLWEKSDTGSWREPWPRARVKFNLPLVMSEVTLSTKVILLPLHF